MPLADSLVVARLRLPYTVHMIQPGRYRHYKGHEYEVLGVACHSETEEEYVVYRALYGDHGLWIRPTAMFLETVTLDGRPCPRFQFLAAH